MKVSAVLLLFAAAVARGGALPGFQVQLVTQVSGFADSIAIDSHNTIYYTTTDGNLFRFRDGKSQVVTHVNTNPLGNSGLLGLALRDDNTAIVHYTTFGQIDDVISSINLTTGEETVLHAFDADIQVSARGSGPEHHGGNPTVGADGSIFVGIGDYGTYFTAPLPEWNGGKVFRIFPDGTVQQFARGFRNPYDLSWDDAKQRLIMTDNGDTVDDEIDVVHLGDFCGWPDTAGNKPQVDGSVPPVYVFSSVVAPTGIIAVNGANSYFPKGYLLGAFVKKAIYYIPDVDARPFPDPVAVIEGVTPPIVDVANAPNGDIYFVTGAAVYQLVPPRRGDCNGDGSVDAFDISALEQELADGNPEPSIAAQNGAFAGSWGCDVNGDGLIDTRDLTSLLSMVAHRSRAVRSH